MSHRYALILSHLGCDLVPLLESLNNSSEITIHEQPLTYRNWHDIYNLSMVRNTSSVMHINMVLFNQSMHFIKVPEECKLIVYLGHPYATIKNMEINGYCLENAIDYYRFRLQRIVQITKANADKVCFLTYNDLDMVRLQKFLGLSQRLNRIKGFPIADNHNPTAKYVDAIYNKHLNRIVRILKPFN